MTRMKQTVILSLVIAAILTLPMVSVGQQPNPQIASLLPDYYRIKDALVKNHAGAAAAAAADFSRSAEALALSKSASKQKKTSTLHNRMIDDAISIAATQNLAEQRSSFQSLSQKLITLSKGAKLPQPAYIAYCPMKKAYWLSREKEIENPYYGSEMLTCGNITGTIK
jgi:hypothetical protein